MTAVAGSHLGSQLGYPATPEPVRMPADRRRPPRDRGRCRRPNLIDCPPLDPGPENILDTARTFQSARLQQPRDQRDCMSTTPSKWRRDLRDCLVIDP